MGDALVLLVYLLSALARLFGPGGMRAAIGVDIDKHIVVRVLTNYYRPGSGNNGSSWLMFIGHMKDSLWSIGLFRFESVTLNTRTGSSW